MDHEVIQVFPNGPYRLFSATNFPGSVPISTEDFEGYVGCYVCALCQSRTHTVVKSSCDWICMDCEAHSVRRARDYRDTVLRRAQKG